MRWAQIATVVAALPLGCYGATVDDEDCAEGMQITCGCDDGSTGAQICQADGTFGACACDVPGSGSGGSPSPGEPSTGGKAGDGSAGASTGGATAGGATGTGGSTGGSSGGAVGKGGSTGSGGTLACNPTAGAVKGDGSNLEIDSLDDTDTMFSTAGVGMGAWDFSKDLSTGTIVPANTAGLMPEAGGLTGSALHVQGTGLTGWGAALSAFLNGPTSSFDASAYGGIAFDMKGSTTVFEGPNKVMVLARMPDLLPGAGSCCNDAVAGLECYSTHRAVITISSEWNHFVLPWQAFVGPTWGLGSTMAFNPNRIRDIVFSFNNDVVGGGEGASFDVWIDGLAFEPL